MLLFTRDNIRINESTSGNHLASSHTDWTGKHGACMHKCMEFPILSAWINRRWEALQKCSIELPARKVRRQVFRINAGDRCANTGCDHSLRKLPCRFLPERENRTKSCPAQAFNPVLANIFHKQVPKRNILYTAVKGISPNAFHGTLVDFIGTRPGNFDFVKRNPQPVCLRFQQTFPNSVDRYASKMYPSEQPPYKLSGGIRWYGGFVPS